MSNGEREREDNQNANKHAERHDRAPVSLSVFRDASGAHAAAKAVIPHAPSAFPLKRTRQNLHIRPERSSLCARINAGRTRQVELFERRETGQARLQHGHLLRAKVVGYHERLSAAQQQESIAFGDSDVAYLPRRARSDTSRAARLRSARLHRHQSYSLPPPTAPPSPVKRETAGEGKCLCKHPYRSGSATEVVPVAASHGPARARPRAPVDSLSPEKKMTRMLAMEAANSGWEAYGLTGATSATLRRAVRAPVVSHRPHSTPALLRPRQSHRYVHECPARTDHAPTQNYSARTHIPPQFNDSRRVRWHSADARAATPTVVIRGPPLL